MTDQTSRMEFPFPTRDDDPWYSKFSDFAQAIDGSTYASREDRSLIFGGGGTVDVSISGSVATVTWSETITISSPIGGFLLQIAAGSEDLNDGEILYTTLVRQPLINTSVSVSVANKLPGTNGDNTIVIAVRMGSYVYFRTGIRLGDGESSSSGIAPNPVGGTDPSAIHVNAPSEISGIASKSVPTTSDLLVIEDVADSNNKKRVLIGSLPGISTDKKTAAIVVGNSVAGDTSSNCDYLDTGNGAQLAVAIAAAGQDDDVYIRPGLYDFSVAGGPSAPITLDGIRVRCAGPTHTRINTNVSGDCGAFILTNGAILEDVYILASEPTGLQTTSLSIILCSGDSECKRVHIDFENSWVGADPGDVIIEAAFRVNGSSASKVKILNCKTENTYSSIISYLAREGEVLIDGCYSEDGTYGAYAILSTSKTMITNCTFDNSSIAGVTFNGVSNGMLSNSILKSLGAGYNGVIVSNSNRVHVVSNYFEADTGAGGSSVDINNSDYCVVSSNTSNGEFVSGCVTLDSTSNNNVVIGNVSGDSYVDSGSSNELAHNV